MKIHIGERLKPGTTIIPDGIWTFCMLEKRHPNASLRLTVNREEATCEKCIKIFDEMRGYYENSSPTNG